MVAGLSGVSFAGDGTSVATTGGKASAIWTFNSKTTLTVTSMSVTDTLADGYGVYVRLVTKSPSGSVSTYTNHWNRRGSGTTVSWASLPAGNSAGMEWVSIEVCRGDDGADTCMRAAWQHNDEWYG